MICKNGYEMVDKMFEEIDKSKNHEISLESSFQFIDFYGLIDGCTLHKKKKKRQFVGRCVLERLNKAFLEGEICIKADGETEQSVWDLERHKRFWRHLPDKR